MEHQERLVQDTLILQKVNGAHREAFKSKFPGQCEHILRLTAERLQSILVKKPEDMSDPGTWVSTPQDIRDLSQALLNVYQISRELTNN